MTNSDYSALFNKARESNCAQAHKILGLAGKKEDPSDMNDKSYSSGKMSYNNKSSSPPSNETPSSGYSKNHYFRYGAPRFFISCDSIGSQSCGADDYYM